MAERSNKLEVLEPTSRGSYYSECGHWARHYSNVRLVIALAGILMNVWPFQVDRSYAWLLLLALVDLGCIVLFGYFTFFSYVWINRQRRCFELMQIDPSAEPKAELVWSKDAALRTLAFLLLIMFGFRAFVL